LLKQATLRNKMCVIGTTSVLSQSANIVNNLKQKESIKIGEYSHIKGELLVLGHGGLIEIGDYCFVGTNTHIWSGKHIKIGNRVLISHNCNIFDNDTHPLDPKARHKQYKEIMTTGQPKFIDLKDEEIFIEDDVLIGANSIILKGVVISKGAVVAAGSVVTKSVPPYVVVAGNPAKVIRDLVKDGTVVI
jgi:acetyltransferase-like isoleucine patch superfamily enzyme